MTNPVYFIGAGPGDPELITVKGQRLLQEADVIVYTGSLVPKALLQGVAAEIHNSAGLNLDEVLNILIPSWTDGKKVVRLHTGDPAIYGGCFPDGDYHQKSRENTCTGKGGIAIACLAPGNYAHSSQYWYD